MARRNFATVAANNSSKIISADWVNDLDAVIDRGLSVTPQDFGAVGDGATDDSAAFIAAIAYLKSIATHDQTIYKASGELFIPAGHYYLGTTALDITHTFRMRGEVCSAQQGLSYATRLRWAHGTDGIRVQRYNTSGATTVDGANHYGGDGFSLEDVWLKGGYAGTEGEHHGLRVKSRFNARRVILSDWSGDGIFCDENGNTNNSRLDQVYTSNCRDGVNWAGGDANAWTIIDLDTTYSRRWGRNNNCFLNSTEVGGHSADNGLVVGSIPTMVSHNGNKYSVVDGQAVGASTNAPSGTTADNTWWYYVAVGAPVPELNIPAWLSGTTYRAGGAGRYANSNAGNVILGPYTEGGQGPIQAVAGTMFIGGAMGAGLKGTAIHVRNYFGILEAAKVGSVSPTTGASVVISGTEGLKFDHADDGAYALSRQNGDIAWVYGGSGDPANWAFALTTEDTSNAIGARRMNFPNGYGLNSKKVLSGTAAPVAGTYAQGDMVWNSAPAAGGAPGWVCVTGGTPGTWKAMANLAA